MQWLQRYLGLLSVGDLDSLFVRWLKMGSMVMVGMLGAASIFYVFLRLKAFISRKKDTVDRSLDYDVAEWIQDNRGRMPVEDVDDYARILPRVFRREEYRRVREEYEATMSTKRKEALFRQALFVLHQEIVLFQAGRAREHDAT